MTRILLVYNHWEWKLMDPLSLLIRMVTYGPNHAAILQDGVVYEMQGSNLWWMIKKLLGRNVSYEANSGSGFKSTPLSEWEAARLRDVEEYEPLVPVIIPKLKAGYGFLDLVQRFLQIIRKKWLLIGHHWNGQDGVRWWPGTVCDELVTDSMGLPAVMAPADLQRLPQLRHVRTYTTVKQK